MYIWPTTPPYKWLKFSLEMLFVWTFNALDRDETPYLKNLDIVGP